MSIIGDIVGYIDSGRASKSISDSNIAAEHGVLNAVSSGQAGVTNSLAQNLANLNGAQGDAYSDVNGATGNANSTLGSYLQPETANLNPYLQSGQQANAGFQAHAAANPQFSFDPSTAINSQALQFQQQQGDKAVNNQLASEGLANSGAAAKELSQYNQGLASTYYQNAFNDAQSTFNTNQNATMQNLGALANQGQYGTSQYNQVMSNAGNQQASNTLNAGYYGGNTQMTVAQLLAQQNLQGNEFNSSTGLMGSEAAGNYAVGAGIAHANGVMNQGAALTSGIGDTASALMGL